MNFKNLKYLMIILVFSISCNEEETDSLITEVYLNHYSFEDEIKETDTIFQEIISDSTFNYYKYSEKLGTDTILGFSFRINKTDDSEIFMFNQSLPLIKTKHIEIEGKKYKINRYYYDDPNGQDEESSYFYCDEYGLLVLYNDGWLTLIFSLYSDSVSKQLTDSIISDTTELFGYYISYEKPPEEPKE